MNKTLLITILFFALFYQANSQTGCPEVIAGDDITLDCTTGNTANLSATFLEIGETTRYDVESIDFNPPFPFDAGDPIQIVCDDRWSEIVDLPFNSCFFDQSYTDVQVGANGVVTFGSNFDPPSNNNCTTGDQCPWNFSDPIPDTNFPILNAIFGAYHDLNNQVNSANPNATGDIFFGVLGEAPCRSFVVNFFDFTLYDCDDQKTTQQIVLYENTNIIEVYLREKSTCLVGFNSNSVLGIINENGTDAVVPPNRNTGEWEATEEAWRFVPGGDPITTFTWYDEDGNIVSNDTEVTVNPTETTTYTAEVVYRLCDGDDLIVTDELTVNVDDGGIDIVEPDDLIVCDDEPFDGVYLFNLGSQTAVINHTSDPNLVITYHTSASDASTGTDPISNIDAYENTSNPQTIFASALNTSNDCRQSVQFELIVNGPADFNLIPTVEECDDDSDGIALFDLLSIADDIRVNGTDAVSFHLTQDDAITGDDPLASPYENSSNPQTIWVRIDNMTGCFTTTPIAVELSVVLNPEVIPDQFIDECSNTGSADFDLTELDNQVTIETDVTITYHETEELAQSGDNPLSSPYTSSSRTIWVRVENADGCYTIVSAELLVINSPTVTLDDLFECEVDPNEATFDLDAYISDLEASFPGIAFTIHETLSDAESGVNPISGDYTNTSNPQTLWVAYEDPLAPECGSEDSFELIVQSEPAFNTIPDQEQCDETGGGVASFDLDALIDDIRTNSTDVVTFHLTETEAIDGINPLVSPYENILNPQFIFVMVESEAGCRLITPFVFQLIVNDNPEFLTGGFLEECSDAGTADFDLTGLDSQVTNETDVTITYHETEALAESGTNPLSSPFNTASTTVWARIENSNECFSIVSAELIVIDSPTVSLTDLFECEITTDEATFDLDEYISSLQMNFPGIDFSIHLTQMEAQDGMNPISGDFTNTSNPQTLWVAFEDPSAPQCGDVDSFNLIVQPEPGFNAILDQELCDDNDDEIASFDLNALVNDIQLNASDVVTFYANAMDAIDGVNSLSSPYENTANPQTIYVMIESDAGCRLNVPFSFDLIVLEQPNINSGASLELCSVESSADFDLFLLDDQITMDMGVTITYHETQNDAEANTSALSSPYTSESTTIWVRVEGDNGCVSITTAELIVTNEPNITLNNFEQCDDDADGIAVFDLDQYLLNLQTSFPTLILSIHANETDADNIENELTGLYTNMNNPEALWVAVVDPLAPQCNGSFSFDLIVNPLPAIENGPFTLDSCNLGGVNLGTGSYNLIDANQQIAPGSSYIFTYHETQADADQGVNPLPNTDYISNETIVFVRIETTDGCFVTTTLQLIVNPIPIANAVSDSLCSQSSIGEFELGVYVSAINGGAPNVTTSFHQTIEEAELATGNLSSPYSTESTVIFARVSDDFTGCYQIAEVTLDVIVAPDTSIDQFTSCEDGISNSALFDLEQLRDQVESDTNGMVTFHNSQTHAEEGINDINGIYPSSGETIWVRITTSLPDCQGIRAIELVVNQAPPIQDIVVQNCRLTTDPNQFVFDLGTLASEYDYSVHNSISDAEIGNMPINFPITTSSDNERYYLRTVDPATNCHSVSSIDLDIVDFVTNQLETTIVCYGQTFLLPDGRVIREEGLYTYQNVENCTNDIYDLDFQVCNPDEYCQPLMPSGFSPSTTTGMNDAFELLVPTGCTLIIDRVEIFNRWGEKVYEAFDNEFSWDGFYNSEAAQQGVYVWYIDYSYIDDQGNEGEQNREGTVFLLR